MSGYAFYEIKTLISFRYSETKQHCKIELTKGGFTGHYISGTKIIFVPETRTF